MLFPKQMVGLGATSKLSKLKQWPRWKIKKCKKKGRVQFLPFSAFTSSPTLFFPLLLRFPIPSVSRQLTRLATVPADFQCSEEPQRIPFPFRLLRVTRCVSHGYVQKLHCDTSFPFSKRNINTYRCVMLWCVYGTMKDDDKKTYRTLY